MSGGLRGQLALVTGASRGIGRAAALCLAREGAHVIAVARSVGALESLDDEIKSLGNRDGAIAALRLSAELDGRFKSKYDRAIQAPAASDLTLLFDEDPHVHQGAFRPDSRKRV